MEQTLTIKMNLSLETIPVYCIININNYRIYDIYLTKKRAKNMCAIKNKIENKKIYFVIEKKAFK